MWLITMCLAQDREKGYRLENGQGRPWDWTVLRRGESTVPIDYAAFKGKLYNEREKTPLMFNLTNSSEHTVFQWSAEHRKDNSSEKYAHLGEQRLVIMEQPGHIPTFKYT